MSSQSDFKNNPQENKGSAEIIENRLRHENTLDIGIIGHGI